MATILFIEDDELLMKSLGDRLRERGYTVVHAQTVADARAVAAKHHPDAIIADVTLPDGDGLAAAKEVRTLVANNALPIIILTNNDSPRLTDEALNGIGISYLLKAGHRMDDIVAAVAAVVS